MQRTEYVTQSVEEKESTTEEIRESILGPMVRPGDIRFNDILMNIPPESISIIQTEYANTNFMLREPVPTTTRSGKKKILAHIPLIFDLGVNGSNYSSIAKLITQVRKCPIITVENEKLRTEIYGPGSDESISMAFIVESISGSIDGEFPTLLRCDLQMSWFNHLPYTPSVLYRGNEDGTEPMISKFPTSLYKEFYHHGTSKEGILINDPTYSDLLLDDALDIFYKEYSTFNESVLIGSDSSKPSQLNKRVKTRNEKASTLLKDQGWVPAAERLGYPDIDGVYYRWRKFSIPVSALNENGPLILESLSFGLNTNVAYIPLQGYSVPTAQFMGGSVASINGIVFAGAQVDEENNPIGTCPKLGALQKIFDTTSENRFIFEKYAGEDCVLMRHPVTKLMKYRAYTENRFKTTPDGKGSSFRDSFFFDPESPTDSVFEFDYDDMLPVVVTNRVSSTVDGHPFASRFQFQSRETRLKNDNDSIRIAGDTSKQGPGKGLARSSAKETWLGVAKILEEQYKIKKIESDTGAYFSITQTVNTPDREEADMLVECMTPMLTVDPTFTNLDSIINSPWFTKSEDEINAQIQKNRYADYQNNRTSNRRLKRTNLDQIINSEKIPQIVASVLRKAAQAGSEAWAGKYQISAQQINSLLSITGSETYADLMIPPDRLSPSYYFYDFEDEALHKTRAMKGMASLAEKLDENIIKMFTDKEAYKSIGQDTKPSVGGLSTAFSMASNDPKGKKHSIVHNPADADHRNLLALQSMGMASSMTSSLKQAFPTFKIFLRQDNFFFERELSVSDKSAKEQKNLSTDFRDFSEFFDVSNVIDIRLVKDENVAADMLVMRIVATDRDKVNKIKKDIELETMDHKYTQKMIKDTLADVKSSGGGLTAAEEHLKKYGLSEGTRIQARLGYDTNANTLPVEFNGKIVSVRGKEIIEVICLGNGEELVTEIKAATVADEYSFNSNTPDLVAELLENSPEVVSFGNLNYKSDTGFEIGIMPEFLGGRTVLDNIFAPSLFGGYTAATASVNALDNAALVAVTAQAVVAVGLKVGLLAAASAPPLLLVLGVAVAGAALYEGYKSASRWLFGCPFTIYNNTIWDVFQELTLRHPGTICGVVPYDNRSTIFFGEPNETYFYRGPTPIEAALLPRKTFFNRTTREIYDYDVLGLDKEWGESQAQDGAILRNSKKKEVLSNIRANTAPSTSSTILGMIKPYRSYHLVASEHDIIANTIECTSRDVANAVQVAYPSDADEGNFDGSVGFTDYKLSYELKADDDLYREFLKKKVLTFHNAHADVVDDLPERYAKASLVKELERVYRGKLTIMGRPGIKPHDVIIMRDTVNDIMGPIGVAKVIHIMSPHNGWITEIVPKMMVFPDNASGVYQLSLITKGAAYWLSDEYQRFYTNLRRYMPSESGFSNLGTNLFDLGRLIGGSDTIDYENMGFEDKDSIERMNTGSTVVDRNIQTSAIIGSAAAAMGLQTLALSQGVPQALAQTTLTSFNATKAAATLAATEAGKGVFAGVIAREVGGKTVAESVKYAAGSTAFSKVATSSISAGLNAGTTLTKGVLTLGSAFTGPLVHLGMSAFVDAIVSWTKYRQPIMFFPLYREGEAWYAAMNGFKDNTIVQHFSEEYGKVKNKFEFYGLYVDRIFEEFKR